MYIYMQHSTGQKRRSGKWEIIKIAKYLLSTWCMLLQVLSLHTPVLNFSPRLLRSFLSYAHMFCGATLFCLFVFCPVIFLWLMSRPYTKSPSCFVPLCSVPSCSVPSCFIPRVPSLYVLSLHFPSLHVSSLHNMSPRKLCPLLLHHFEFYLLY
jgi:uncharacterized membrane protein